MSPAGTQGQGSRTLTIDTIPDPPQAGQLLLVVVHGQAPGTHVAIAVRPGTPSTDVRTTVDGLARLSVVLGDAPPTGWTITAAVAGNPVTARTVGSRSTAAAEPSPTLAIQGAAPPSAPPISGARFDVAADVPPADTDWIKSGIAATQAYLAHNLGGGIDLDHVAITVKVVATGLGNQDPGGGGACCTGLAETGGRPFFDVKHPGWNGGTESSWPWGIAANRMRTAAHEWTHAWAWSLGGMTIHNQPLGDWLDEGIAQFVAYSAMVEGGLMRSVDVNEHELTTAVSGAGVLVRCLACLEHSIQARNVWPGDVGYLAVKQLVMLSPSGVRSIRMVNEAVGRGATFDQAFYYAFGLTRQQFYDDWQSRYAPKVIGISGQVKDAAGKGIPGVAVLAWYDATSCCRWPASPTDMNGLYTYAILEDAPFKLRADVCITRPCDAGVRTRSRWWPDADSWDAGTLLSPHTDIVANFILAGN